MYKLEEISTKLKRVINEICVLDIEITDDTPLANLNFDSLSFIRLIVLCEEEFNFEFEDIDLVVGQYEYIKDLVNVISKKVIR